MASPSTDDVRPSRPAAWGATEIPPVAAAAAAPPGADADVALAGAVEAPLLGGIASAVALALAMFVEAVGYGMVAPTLPFLARQAGANQSGIGFLVGLYAAVGLLVSIPFGALANRYGRRTLILVGLACLTAASIGFIFAPSYAWLVVARSAQGLGATAIWVGSLTVAADLSPSASMGRSLSILTGSWALGFVVGPALGGLGSVRFPFVLYAALSAAALVAGLALLPETGRPGVRTTLAGILGVLRLPSVLASAAATFSMSFFYGTVEAFLPLMVNARGVGRGGIGLLFMIAGLPSVVLPQLTGRLADRLGDRRMIRYGLLYAAVLNASFLLLIERLPLWVLFVLVGVVEVMVYVPAVALLHRGMERDERIFATGSFLGPLLGGLLVPLGGYALMFAMLTVVMLAGVVVAAAARGRAV